METLPRHTPRPRDHERAGKRAQTEDRRSAHSPDGVLAVRGPILRHGLSTRRSSTPTEVRRAAIGAATYPAWREFEPRLEILVEHDDDEPARARATGAGRVSRQRVGITRRQWVSAPIALESPRHMARRRLEGLERVLGVNALFSTAYGNVGSSIYYALGLVAALALGLTPLVFLITGIFFLCTAATYAEATAMYPEAGGSSLVRAARVQRVLVVLRRLGPDAQLRGDGRDLRVLRPALPRQRVRGSRCATRRGTSSSARSSSRCCPRSTSSASRSRRA